MALSSLLALILAAQTAAPEGGARAADDSNDGELYRERVAPLLTEHCFECHGSEGRAKGGLRLTSRRELLAGGDSGPMQRADGTFDGALLLSAIEYEDEFLQMPPSGKLDAAEIELLRTWLGRGAPYGEGAAEGAEAHGGDEVEGAERITRGDGMTGWAYRPLARPEVPGGASGDAARAIDAFVRARLAALGLAPSPPAGERALVRRLHFDLLGLPPTPEEVEAYVADPRPDKWERLIDRLLASPHHGEHWGRHWLDVVRYADTNGFERDSDKPNIWRYRDWVVDALNADLPYDRFVVAQLAGDELEPPDRSARIASGYLRLQQWDDEPGAGALQGRYDTLDDIVSTTGQAFLGSTIGCARCHDHKADPFDAEHYYGFMAFFHGLTDMSVEGTQVDVSTPEEAARADRAEAEKRSALAAASAERRDLAARLFAALRLEGAPRAAALGPLEELEYRFYRGAFAALPDFEMLRPEESGALEGGYLDLSPRTRDEDVAFVEEGFLGVEATREYELRLVADDGARLTVGTAPPLVVDGVSDEPRRVSARVQLEAGRVPLRLEWFNAGGAPTLHVDWRSTDDAMWRYTTSAPDGGDAWREPGFDDSAWPVGEAGFGARGTPGTEVRTEWDTDEIWLRRSFEWRAAEGDEPVLVLHHDDDVEVYVNGALALARTGYVTAYQSAELEPAGRAALRSGTNTLAVHCRQDFGGRYVHVAVVPRSSLDGAVALRDVAFARRPISLPDAETGEVDLGRLAELHGDRLLGEGTLARYRSLEARIREFRARPVPRSMAFVARERGGEPPPMHVHVRGSAHALGAPVEPYVPAFIAAPELPPIVPRSEGGSSGRRLALARWIASEENALAVRVIVNRVWQHHFGRGLVASPNDFGELGERPSHPELLDWLCNEFIARGMSLKELHRAILRTETWRQNSRGRDDALAVDAANELLWRHSPRRLTAEEVHDTLLSVAGMLERERGGPGVFGRMPEAALATSSKPEEVWGTSPLEDRNRRALYVKVKRSLLTPFLVAHDMADVDASCPARFTTILPTQALQMLNGDFTREVAARMADRLEREVEADASGAHVRARVRRALELALCRPAAPEELDDWLAFHASLASEHGAGERLALELACLTVLNLNELVFVD